MSPATFDAIDYVHKLKESGVPEQQAETHVKVLSEIIESNLASKLDIERIRSDMERMRSEMATKIELEKVKVEIIKWNIGAVLTAAGLFIAIFKLFG